DSAVETMNAILKEDPPELAVSGSRVQPALDRIVRRCLEKNAAERFHSAHDLGLALETLSSESSGASVSPSIAKPRARWLPWSIAGLALALATAAFFAGRGAAPSRDEPPTFQRLTFRRGNVNAARFAGDGSAVVYSALWENEPRRVYSAHGGNAESLTLAYTDVDLASVSRTGELALIMHSRNVVGFARVGTLARGSLTGTGARAVLEDVQTADWLPDGSGFAVARLAEDRRYVLEFPIGKPVYDTAGFITDVRVSPDGTLVAFADHPIQGDDRGSVAVVDRAGKKRTIPGDYASVQGVAWRPDGREIWFTGADKGNARSLFAATLEGTRRIVARVPGSLHLGDIGPDGSVLLWQEDGRSGIVGRAPGDTADRDLSWLDYSTVPRLSADGKTLLFTEEGDGGGLEYSVFMRPTDGGPAVRLGSGMGNALSPDGKWVLTARLNPEPVQYLLLPTGAGDARDVTHDDLAHSLGWFTSDGTRIVFWASAPGHASRVYRQSLSGGAAEPITPEGITGLPSPDGTLVAFQNKIYAAGSAEPSVIPGMGVDERVEGWSSDMKRVYVRQFPTESGAPIHEIDLATGRRTLRHNVARVPGARPGPWLSITPDGAGYFYAYSTTQAELFRVTGLK
ncbi:MAG TPA: hypothetical protein VJ826_07165, partial [Candidatus Polarisedimenticolaceae bacterium]|nr:hypothetical protein [Candidatus Polarisedimenticolaceae bacterium]